MASDTCPDCKALVSDLAAHERWHSRLVSDLAKAVEKEIHRPARTELRPAPTRPTRARARARA